MMGGRGGSSGLSASFSLRNLIGEAQAAQSGGGWSANTDPNKRGDYDDHGNPNLIKYQGQEDDKTASFLAGTDRNVNLNDPQYQDGYSYHNLPLNRLLARMGINKGATVLNDSDFNAYLKATGQTAGYRGWSSSASADRFLNTKNNHVGNGVMGDGYYFSSSRSVAVSYSGSGRMGRGEITRVALSPSARVIDLGALRTAMYRASPKLQSSLSKAGTYGSGRTYGPNSGESQYALKMGYNVIKSGNYYVAVTNDALVVSNKKL